MKIALNLIFLLIASFSSVFAVAADNNVYTLPSAGISFSYPSSMHMDVNSSRDNPLSVVFMVGTPPLSSSVLFKHEDGDISLNEFIEKERHHQKEGEYQNEIQENIVLIKDKINAIEIIRNSPIGKIRWFVFPSIKEKQLYSFWFMSSRLEDINKIALDGYLTMKSSLNLSK